MGIRDAIKSIANVDRYQRSVRNDVASDLSFSDLSSLHVQGKPMGRHGQIASVR